MILNLKTLDKMKFFTLLNVNCFSMIWRRQNILFPNYIWVNVNILRHPIKGYYKRMIFCITQTKICTIINLFKMCVWHSGEKIHNFPVTTWEKSTKFIPTQRNVLKNFDWTFWEKKIYGIRHNPNVNSYSSQFLHFFFLNLSKFFGLDQFRSFFQRFI